jgi:hypothetical protein
VIYLEAEAEYVYSTPISQCDFGILKGKCCSEKYKSKVKAVLEM